MLENKEQIYELVSNIKVMKPNSVDSEDLKNMLKLEALLDSPDYAAEVKIDGCHYIMASCLFFSTRNIEKTDNFPHLHDFFVNLGMPNLILDGEINYPNRTSQYCTRVTGALPENAKSFQDTNGYIHYNLIDMIRTPKGTWLMTEPYKNRRKILEYFYNAFIVGTEMEKYIHLMDIAYDNKREFKDSILASGGEGVVLKKLNGLYLMGKKPAWNWMKIKQSDEIDLFITGFEEATVLYKGKNTESWPYWHDINGESVPVTKAYYMGWIGSLILSAYVDDVCTRVCTSSGLSEAMLIDISANPQDYIDRVVKVGFMEKTEAGIPRHPTVICFHEDKLAIDCIYSFGEEDE